jgi:NitT/TauT family transport system ATP-binding protein
MFAAARSGPKLQILSAAKVYNTRSGDLVAIDRCSFDIGAEEIVSIVGPSGCGKTTLLWSMSGLHSLTVGEVLLDGRPVRGPHPEIGMVFRTPTYSLGATSMPTYAFRSRSREQSPIELDHELLTRVGLDGFGERFPRELSGGMQQRAALGEALSFKPQSC